ncbi:MAG TPA: hypothetical protein VID48_13395 [Solirubrobacteraceae bacterium]|jgi:hypothetical protein
MESSRELPFIDAHDVLVENSPAVVWEELLNVVNAGFGRSVNAVVASLLGCDPASASGGDLSMVGATLPGFRVAGSYPQQRLELEGRHRFSSYKLVFVIEPLAELRCRLRAETWAVFPGIAGRIYGTLVVGSRGHVLVVRSLLAGVRRRASMDLPSRHRVLRTPS